MRRVVFDDHGRLRNGCWVLAFIAALAALSVVQYGLVEQLKAAGVPGGRWRLGVGFLTLLAATGVCTRLRGERLSSVGFKLDGRWARELGAGTALGIAQLVVATTLLWAVGGVRLGLDPDRSALAVLSGLGVYLLVALNEETLFRGFLFQRMREGMGLWPTQLALAALFALAHWQNPGMEGGTRVWATLDIGIGALVLGMAYVRTESLALPIGIHLGWNWMQGTILGFGVSGNQSHGWLKPVLLDRPDWVTGGPFGLEASVFGVVVDLTLLALLLAWRGSLPPAVPPVPPSSLP
jgi:membrane protease YdiL (CAAX protease family)